MIKLKDRRGDATDPMIILIVLVFLAISFVVAIFVNTKISSIISTTALNETSVSSTIISSLDRVNTVTVQRGFIVILAFMTIFTLLSAFLVRQHPAFIFLNIIFLIVTLFVAVFVANLYGTLADNPTLGPVIESQFAITFVMQNLIKIIMALGGLNMVILFSKLFGAPQGGGDF